MFLDLPLGDTEQLRELVRGQPGSLQQLDHALTCGPFLKRHMKPS
jgi:hypothetical protein